MTERTELNPPETSSITRRTFIKRTAGTALIFGTVGLSLSGCKVKTSGPVKLKTSIGYGTYKVKGVVTDANGNKSYIDTEVDLQNQIEGELPAFEGEITGPGIP